MEDSFKIAWLIEEIEWHKELGSKWKIFHIWCYWWTYCCHSNCPSIWPAAWRPHFPPWGSLQRNVFESIRYCFILPVILLNMFYLHKLVFQYYKASKVSTLKGAIINQHDILNQSPSNGNGLPTAYPSPAPPVSRGAYLWTGRPGWGCHQGDSKSLALLPPV